MWKSQITTTINSMKNASSTFRTAGTVSAFAAKINFQSEIRDMTK